jgi:hypothetical protein
MDAEPQLHEEASAEPQLHEQSIPPSLGSVTPESMPSSLDLQPRPALLDLQRPASSSSSPRLSGTLQILRAAKRQKLSSLPALPELLAEIKKEEQLSQSQIANSIVGLTSVVSALAQHAIAAEKRNEEAAQRHQELLAAVLTSNKGRK